MTRAQHLAIAQKKAVIMGEFARWKGESSENEEVMRVLIRQFMVGSHR